MLSLDDQLARPPRPLQDGEVLELGGAALTRRVVEVATPHVPHNWESHMFFEQETGTLFCGDLLTQVGDGAAITDQDILEDAIAAEEMFLQTSLGPAVPATYRRLADLHPQRLAIMHGSSYAGDCAGLLRRMADEYEQRFGCGQRPVPAQALPEHDQPGTPAVLG
jgi:flavorubredoxin